MTTRWLTSLLLLSTALTMPSLARAADARATFEPQGTPTQDAPDGGAAPNPPAEESAPPPPDVSIPGGGDSTVVTIKSKRGTSIRVGTQVSTVLSTLEIARMGEGNIAGALGRVPGLSVVGGGYVYVRGLGDRYSLAMLNGSPLPSPVTQ